MEKDYQKFFLNELLQIWKRNTEMRPTFGVWIAEIKYSEIKNEPKNEIAVKRWYNMTFEYFKYCCI